MSDAPDLFVVCRSCGAEVSKYVTECPYCGARMQQRAPKIARGQIAASGTEPKRQRKRRERSRRTVQAPGKPFVSLTLAASCAIGAVLIVPGVVLASEVGVVGQIDGQWWRLVTASFFADNLWYTAASVVAIALFGGLIERRHGAVVAGACFAICAVGGMAAAAGLETIPLALGANAAALGLIGAWVIAPVLETRRGEQPSVDLIGTAIYAAVLLLMPLAAVEASSTAGAAGLILGLLAGSILARR
ncbi:MAG: rhomboid family intramembrane serine protease [Solirubrobacteraceae bacterium]|jgi:membrane associated rhomboid family serine protease|nr:rhomboid family intramembrane serine protease [Solirubrobacteraceae bacterium]